MKVQVQIDGVTLVLKTTFFVATAGFACVAASDAGPKTSFQVRLAITNSCHVRAAAAPTPQPYLSHGLSAASDGRKVKVSCTRPVPYLVEIAPAKNISVDDGTNSGAGASIVTVTF